MEKESRTQQNQDSGSNKQLVDPRANPLARTAKVSATRESRRPAERSVKERAHTR